MVIIACCPDDIDGDLMACMRGVAGSVSTAGGLHREGCHLVCTFSQIIVLNLFCVYLLMAGLAPSDQQVTWCGQDYLEELANLEYVMMKINQGDDHLCWPTSSLFLAFCAARKKLPMMKVLSGVKKVSN